MHKFVFAAKELAGMFGVLLFVGVVTGFMEYCASDEMIVRAQKVSCTGQRLTATEPVSLQLTCGDVKATTREAKAIVAFSAGARDFTCKIYRSERAECIK